MYQRPAEKVFEPLPLNSRTHVMSTRSTPLDNDHTPDPQYAATAVATAAATATATTFPSSFFNPSRASLPRSSQRHSSLHLPPLTVREGRSARLSALAAGLGMAALPGHISVPSVKWQNLQGEVKVLEGRVASLQETVRAKEMTIAAQKQTVDYQEGQIKRLRDTVFLLRSQVAELVETMNRHLIEVPPLSKLPATDEVLENAHAYKAAHSHDVAKGLQHKFQQDLANALPPAPTTEPRAARRKTTVMLRASVKPPTAAAEAALAVTSEGSSLPATTAAARRDAAETVERERKTDKRRRQFQSLSLGNNPTATREEASQPQLQTATHTAAWPVDTRDRERDGDQARVTPATGGPSPVERDSAAVTTMGKRELHPSRLYSFEATPLLKSILTCQFRKEEMQQILRFLLGNEARSLFEEKCLQLVVEATIFYLVSKNIVFHNDLQKFIPQWLQILVDVVEAERGSIFIFDPDRGELFSRCLTGSFSMPIRVKKGAGIIGSVFESGVPLLIDDVYKDPRFNPTVDKGTKFRTKSVLCVPLRLGPKVVGVVQLLNKRCNSGDGCFTEADFELAQSLGNLITPGLTSPKLHRKLRYHYDNEKRLIKQAISGTKERIMSPLVREVMRGVANILQAERCTLFLSDAARGKLWAIVAQGIDNIQIEIPENRGIAGAVFMNNILLNIPDAYKDPRFNQAVDRESGFRTRTILGSPIRHPIGGQPIGVIQAINKLGGVFTRNDEDRMNELCSIVASILLTSESLEELTLSAELNERVFQCLSVALIVVSAQGSVIKMNSEAADVFYLESAQQWLGRHLSELFGRTNPQLLAMWTQAVEGDNEVHTHTRIYPFTTTATGGTTSSGGGGADAAEGTVKAVRVLPITSDESAHGVIFLLSDPLEGGLSPRSAAAALKSRTFSTVEGERPSDLPQQLKGVLKRSGTFSPGSPRSGDEAQQRRTFITQSPV
ncbi:unnamed protein product [Vitrella brassicaformis CCMP3155]|uniref:GAF domain-containing protein n=2 Tax=Vitrella brassicaformis TaxID=1169539 RepID=A0A0G4FHD9_VITBC|nr:unnamed protein product [Vitrella brassicaformis CCMP3155]|eukprot:CEM12878.1 unnamed protein product [Vitrella brassicaformis CCMP3155]